MPYGAAGGIMLYDLFQGDDGGWLEDPAPLDRPFTEKLQAEAEAIATEGRKWIKVSLDLPYGYSHGLRRLSGDLSPMMDEEGAAHAKLLAEYRALEEGYEGHDEFSEEIYARLGESEVAMEKLEARPLIFDTEEIARAGVFVMPARYGELAVYRGFVGPEDQPRADVNVHRGEQAADGQGGWCRPRHGDHLSWSGAYRQRARRRGRWSLEAVARAAAYGADGAPHPGPARSRWAFS